MMTSLILNNTFYGFNAAAGVYCTRYWDGWLCWGDTPAGTYASQNCPDYFSDLDHNGEQQEWDLFSSKDEITFDLCCWLLFKTLDYWGWIIYQI